jgi:hypothetical protein
VEDAVSAGLLVVLAGTLVLLSVRAFRRYRNRTFLLLLAAFVIALAEGLVISVIVLGLVQGDSLPLSIVAIVQVVVLLLIYGATLSRG